MKTNNYNPEPSPEEFVSKLETIKAEIYSMDASDDEKEFCFNEIISDMLYCQTPTWLNQPLEPKIFKRLVNLNVTLN